MHLSRAVPMRPNPLASRSLTFFLILSSLSVLCLAQTKQSDPRAGYQTAMEEKQTNSRIVALESWQGQAASDPLRADALEVLVWDYKKIGNQSKASAWAQKLLDIDADNALALAALADSARYHEGSTLDQNMADSLSFARRGLHHFPYLHRPEAMDSPEFLDLQNSTQAWLNGAAGFAYVHQQDYVTARNYLRKAATLQPGNPQYVYELALADLMGKQQEPKEGFVYLARAVNLTQGTPAGQQIAAYAAGRYQQAGGTPQDWNQYLAATAPAGRAAVTVAEASPAPSATAPTTPSATIAANQTPTRQLPQSSAPQPKPQQQEAKGEANTHISEEQIAATLAPPPLPPAQTAPKPVVRAGAPVSLGILLEASLKSGENKRAVTYALTDLVRNMARDDEAFVLSFSHDLVFEQDLTSNADYLREAVESVKPQSGTALLDAVTFASGHLDRISRKGSQRVLLVVSDGRDISSHSSPYDVTGAIDASGVKIYCIGLDIGDSADRSRLEALAQRSGGRASFAHSANFRGAVQDVARNLGIYFPQQASQ